MSQETDGLLIGRRALVTGGGRRLGRAIALALGRVGCDVVVHYSRSRNEARDVVSELRSLGVGAWAIGADLGSAAELATLFEVCERTAGPVDYLVNSASMFGQSDLRSLELDDVIQHFLVNAWAPLSLIRQLADCATKQDRSAAAVNLLDTRIIGQDREHAAYHLSKRALADLTRMAAVEFVPNVRVNGVAPGAILPPEDRGETYLTARASAAPMRVPGTPRDVTDAVVYLLGAPFVTGEIIFVDGGQNLRPEA